MTRLQVRVASVQRAAQDILAFELEPEAGNALPPFTAGAHIDVELPGLPARQYSLCNAPGERHRYRIAVLKEPASRGGSLHLHEAVKVGDALTISAPKNHFELRPTPGRSLLMAGGIGVTPLLAMAQTLNAEGADWAMHYCARSADRMAFAEALSAAPFSAHLRFHLDDGAAAQRLDPEGLLAGRQPEDQLYVCGPSGFIDWVMAAARAAGWPEAAIHREYFSASVEQRDGDSAFEIEIAPTGQRITVAAGQTALDALLAAGLDIPNSCTEGVCGMCMTPVLAGTPDHRDHFLTEGERALNDHFMPCCSRAKTPNLQIACDY